MTDNPLRTVINAKRHVVHTSEGGCLDGCGTCEAIELLEEIEWLILYDLAREAPECC